MANWRAGDVSPLFPLFQAESAKWLWKIDSGLKSRNSGLTPTACQGRQGRLVWYNERNTGERGEKNPSRRCPLPKL